MKIVFCLFCIFICEINAIEVHPYFTRIDDAVTNTYRSWSSSKIRSELTTQTGVDSIKFTTGVDPVCQHGKIFFDGDGTMSICMEGGTVVQQVGMEQYYYVRNNSGAYIGNGNAVMATGTLGSSGKITVSSAVCDGSINAKYMIGIATEDIPNGSDGYVTWSGLVRDIDTTGAKVGETWNEGSVLYMNPTTDGALTVHEPQPPNIKVETALVIYKHANHGMIIVRVTQHGYMDSMHDVNVSNQLAGDFLYRNSTNQFWTSTSSIRFVTDGLQIGSDTEYMQITKSGFPTIIGTSNYSFPVDDLRFPALSLKVGAVNPPDFKKITDDGSGSVGVYTYFFDKATNENQFAAVQWPHKMAFGNLVSGHIHWIADPGNPGDGTEKVVWGAEFSDANIGSAFSTTITTYSTMTVSTTNLYHHMTNFANIDSTGWTDSRMMMIRVFRCADCAEDTYDHDAGLLEFDVHIPIKGFGDRFDY